MITVGADPEFFVKDGDTIGSAIGKIGGTKEEPLPVPGGAIQEDNVLAELNIDPARSAKEFISNLKSVMDSLTGVVGELVVQSSHEYLKDALISYGPQALQFGCDPDLNAWTGDINPPPSAYTTLRTAGGHLHIGYEDVDETTNMEIVQLCDIFVSVPGVIMEPDCVRRKMYGMAGSMRHKPYGVEYRTPSNFWLKSEDRMEWVYKACIKATEQALDGNAEDIIYQAGGPDLVQSVVNNNRVDEAKAIVDRMGGMVA